MKLGAVLRLFSQLWLNIFGKFVAIPKTDNILKLLLKKESLSKGLLFICLLLSHLSFSQIEEDSLQAGKSPLDSLFDGLSLDALQIDSTLLDSLVSEQLLDQNPDDEFAVDGSFDYAPTKDIVSTINYNAKDSIWYNVKTSTVYLYGEAHIDYGKITMDADLISINYNTQLVCANATQDTSGYYQGVPKFIDGDQEIQALQMCYNYATGRAKISSIYLEQEEWKTYGDTVLMDEDKNIYINDGTFCPCDDVEDGTYIKSKKIKVIPNKKVITGPFNLYIADLPTPIGFAFGYFPMPKSKASGLIIPTWGEDNSRGFFLRDGGYYWAVNDYIGIKALGEYYSNGGWGAGLDMDYKNRYRFSGVLNFDYRNVVRNGDEFNRESTEDYKLKWTHRPVARGGKRFSANVNLASTTYNSNNAQNTQDYLTNTMSSNISYSQALKRTPFSYTLNARHDQNNETGVFNVSLPNGNFSMSRLYPLKKVVTGKKNANRDFLKSIGLSYKFDFDNKMTNKDQQGQPRYIINDVNGEEVSPRDTVYDITTAGTLNYMWDNKKIGMRNTIPINASYKIGTAMTINPSFNYSNQMHIENYEYDVQQNSTGEDVVIIDTVSRFSMTHNYNAGVNFTNRMYGYYGFKGSKTTFRQVISPTIGFRYSPDYSERDEVYQTENVNGNEEKLDKYQNALYRPASGGQQSAITFSLTNAIEMKTIKNDSVNNKISIFDNLGFSTSYNFAADSLKLAQFTFNANTNILGWVNFNSSMNIEPYLYEYDQELDRDVKVNKFAWDYGKSIGNIENARFALGTALNPSKFKRDPSKVNSAEEDFTDLDSLDKNDAKDFTNYAGMNSHDYVNFNMPWNFSVNYNFAYSNRPNSEKDIVQSLTFSGNIKLSPKWDIALRTNYDFEAKEFVYPNLTIHRDLGCWEMNINWVPFGPRQSYGFYINIKANALKDLKFQKQNQWYDK